MFWFWTVAAIVATAIIVDGIYRLVITGRIRDLIDNVPPFGVVTSEPLEGAELIGIPTEDGLRLQASLHVCTDQPRGLILFCPELHGSHWTVAAYASGLLEAGFAVLAFDFRNQGESDHQPGFQPIHWTTERELGDLEAVLSYIAADESLRQLPLGAFGISRGGSTALVAACRHPQIQSVVTDSAYDTMTMVEHFMMKFSRYIVPEWFFQRLPAWHVRWDLKTALRRSERRRHCEYLRLAQEAHHFHQPALLISGKRDSYVTQDVTRRLAEMLGREENVWIVPKAKHNKARDVQQVEYDRRLIEHFSATLPCPEPLATADSKSKTLTERHSVS